MPPESTKQTSKGSNAINTGDVIGASELFQNKPQPARKPEERSAGEKAAIFGVKKFFESNGLEFDEADIPVLKIHTPSKPPFPFLIISLTLFKDFLDILVLVSDLAVITGVGAIVTAFGRIAAIGTMFIISTILFFWVMHKINRMQRYGLAVGKIIVRRYIKNRVKSGIVLGPMEAFLPYIPFATIFALLAYHDENKYVKIILAAAEQLGQAAKAKKIPVAID